MPRVVSLGLPVAWAALIFALSSVETLDTGLGDFHYAVRTLCNMAEYGVLGVLLLRAAIDAAGVAVGVGLFRRVRA